MSQISIIFILPSGETLTELLYEEIPWSAIIEKISTEPWYNITPDKWQFIRDLEILDQFSNAILDLTSIDDKIVITCVKIFEPKIIFMTETEKIITTVSYNDCKDNYNNVSIRYACLQAHLKIKESIGGYEKNIHPFIDEYGNFNFEKPLSGWFYPWKFYIDDKLLEWSDNLTLDEEKKVIIKCIHTYGPEVIFISQLGEILTTLSYYICRDNNMIATLKNTCFEAHKKMIKDEIIIYDSTKQPFIFTTKLGNREIPIGLNIKWKFYQNDILLSNNMDLIIDENNKVIIIFTENLD